MVMVDKQVKPQACWEFEAEVLVLHHPTTISTKYQAMGEYITNDLWRSVKLYIKIHCLTREFHTNWDLMI